VLLVAGVAAWIVRTKHAVQPAVDPHPVATQPAASASPIAVPAVAPSAPSTAASAEVPPVVASAKPAPSAAPSASPTPKPTKPFDARAARAAIDALSPTLIDCKIPIGRSGKIKVAFAPDGSVSSATTLPPFAGTAAGACVEGHIREAKVVPFKGSGPAYNYGFIIPRY
jgi:hypothetical protein